MNHPMGCLGAVGRDMGKTKRLPSIGASLGGPKPVEGVGVKIIQDKLRNRRGNCYNSFPLSLYLVNYTFFSLTYLER